LLKDLEKLNRINIAKLIMAKKVSTKQPGLRHILTNDPTNATKISNEI
jgi:hypothetical protein